MRVFVAGGTGVIGRSLILLLVAAGHEVTASTRTPGRAGLLRSLGAEPAVADGLDRGAVLEAVTRARPDVIIHQMTGLSGAADLRRFDRTFAATNELRSRGTDYLLEAARAAGTRRFIAQSFTGWPNARDGGPVRAGDSVLSMMTGIRGSSNARARCELGWAPRYASWRSGFAHGLLQDDAAERAAAGARAGGRG